MVVYINIYLYFQQQRYLKKGKLLQNNPTFFDLLGFFA